MNREIIKFLKSYHTDTRIIDRLIVSTFITQNNLTIKHNELLLEYQIVNSNKKEYAKFIEFNTFFDSSTTFRIEELIELFEIVISPKEKKVNGAVYTPEFIRKKIINETLTDIKLTKDVICGDLACGCGGFLLTIAEKIKSKYNTKSYYDIYKTNIYGVDIADYSIIRTKILLSLKALLEGEDKKEFIFNLWQGNSLDFNLKEKSEKIKKNNGFDVIVGNPPYVCSRHMDNATKELLDKWHVTKSGHPDLYIPFFQIGFENLNDEGILGYITVNTFFKSINGRALRQYFEDNNTLLLIVNFGSEQIFKNRSTYTCLCFLKKSTQSRVLYIKALSTNLDNIKIEDFYEYEYSSLNHQDGWNLTSTKEQEIFIEKIEKTGISFREKYITRNGIATLRNDVYKFIPHREDRFFFYRIEEDIEYKIEKKICREIINSNKINNEADIQLLKEQIIFPYKLINGKTILIDPEEIALKYPNTLNYLKSRRSDLAKRDKGNRKYEQWYAYGRNQSMDINMYKLFFPHICEKPRFILCEDKDLLFYNGIAVISNDLNELKILKKILESSIFYEYIKATSKDYSSGYISLSKNYIKNFGICLLSDQEKKTLLSLSNQDIINEFLEDKYIIAIPTP